MQQQPVADQAAVDEQVDRVAVALLHLRPGNEAAERKHALGGLLVVAAPGHEHLPFLEPQIDQVFEHLRAEYLVHALPQGRDRRHVQQTGFRRSSG